MFTYQVPLILLEAFNPEIFRRLCKSDIFIRDCDKTGAREGCR